MKQRLKARLERLAPTRAVDQGPGGTGVVIKIRPDRDLGAVHTITAAHALAHRGVSLLRAKRAVEAAIETGEAVLELPAVEDRAALAYELREAGLRVWAVGDEHIDVRELRERQNLTAEQFALRYGIPIRTLQGWEQGRRPDATANTFLLAIARDPEGVARDLEVDLASDTDNA